MLLDVRIYRIKQGHSKRFEELARNETLPFAESLGHRVVAFGASEDDPETFYLIRAFSSSSERARLLDEVYGSEEWHRKYDSKVSALIESYLVAVVPASEEALLHLSCNDPDSLHD